MDVFGCPHEIDYQKKKKEDKEGLVHFMILEPGLKRFQQFSSHFVSSLLDFFVLFCFSVDDCDYFSCCNTNLKKIFFYFFLQVHLSESPYTYVLTDDVSTSLV